MDSDEDPRTAPPQAQFVGDRSARGRRRDHDHGKDRQYGASDDVRLVACDHPWTPERRRDIPTMHKQFAEVDGRHHLEGQVWSYLFSEHSSSWLPGVKGAQTHS
jgi:hypothetical protein